MSLGAEDRVITKDTQEENSEMRLLHGGGGMWPLKDILEEVLRTKPMDPGRSELIYRRVMDKYQQRSDRKRRWIRRMGRSLVSLMASLASSRAFRILTQ